MDVRTFPVLAAEDQRLADGLAVATSRPAARVLAYLLCRAAESELAPGANRRTIGFGGHERSVSKALERSDAAEMVRKRDRGWRTPEEQTGVRTARSEVGSQP